MPNYKRPHVPGATVFLTIVTYNRQELFKHEENIERLRIALRQVRTEIPFDLTAAVILPEHMHFLWTFPSGDDRLSARVGRMKILVTQSLRGAGSLPEDVPISRLTHRESDVWQRRFIDHYVRDDDDFARHLDYIHYNPVKHGLVTCPHLWPHSSFNRWVEKGAYETDWCCTCGGKTVKQPTWGNIPGSIGE